MYLTKQAHRNEHAGRQASVCVTPTQAEAAAKRLWLLIGDEEQKISLSECRYLIAEALSAAGLRTGVAGCVGGTPPDRLPDDSGQQTHG